VVNCPAREMNQSAVWALIGLGCWPIGSDKSNALQVASGNPGGGYATNSFADIFIVTNTVGTATNYLDSGGATNKPVRYYRVRLMQ
jgi:hypothetical protein